MENIKQNPAENRVDRNKSHLKLQCLCEGAIMLALALLLNALKLYQFPNGGSIDLAMIPIFLFALRWGCGWGLLEGFIFGLLQMFIDGAIACLLCTFGWESRLGNAVFVIARVPGLCGHILNHQKSEGV